MMQQREKDEETFIHEAGEGEAQRWPLPLAEHPQLDIVSDFARMAIVPTLPGEAPFLELFGGGPRESHAHGRPSHGRRSHGHGPHGYASRDAASHEPATGGPASHVTISGEGGTTRVRIHGAARLLDERWWSGRFWESAFWDKRRATRRLGARFVAHVPAAVHARVRATAARVSIDGLSGCDLHVEIDAGALKLRDVRGRLVLATEAGRIDGRGVAGSLDVSTTAGSVHLDVASLDAGRHRVHTNMGSVQIDLARGLEVQIDTRTEMGASRVEYPSTRGARTVLEVAADLGAIRVRPSSNAWRAPATVDAVPAGPPYRTADVPGSKDDADVQRILERVADGSLPPSEAKDLLRALGWA